RIQRGPARNKNSRITTTAEDSDRLPPALIANLIQSVKCGLDMCLKMSIHLYIVSGVLIADLLPGFATGDKNS
ncbi:MAG TPA: hypothetical protein VL970_09850, partial [Candidatus Acidoferrales bacterium]|nr:hypothetical protein [Candidatus Acidoferrales bacterium]